MEVAIYRMGNRPDAPTQKSWENQKDHGKWLQGQNGQKMAAEMEKRTPKWDFWPFFRGPQMGRQIRRGWIWRFGGPPIFRPEVPKPLKNRYLGTSGLKIGASQKRQIKPRRIWRPICGPLNFSILVAIFRPCRPWSHFPFSFPFSWDF